jgi:L-ribulose-5-phosphate 4-epimerase
MNHLKEQVYAANLALVEHGLVLFTWGNASAIDRASNTVVIKPSGVPYKTMQAEDMVLVNLETGKTIDSKYRPSSDTPTHLELYRAFPEIGGIVHTHSKHATAWAQAGQDLPCFGTTHADYFYGTIPCTKPMSQAQIENQYELETGKIIIQTFQNRKLKALEIPAVLVHGHASFCWGETVGKAVETAVVLENAAEMAIQTLVLNPKVEAISDTLLEKHYFRKHGKKAYYGQ